MRLIPFLIATALVLCLGLLSGCTTDSDDDGTPSNLGGGSQDNNHHNNGFRGNNGATDNDRTAPPRRLLNPWLSASVGDTAAYRTFAVAGDAQTAQEERHILIGLEPLRVRRYVGGEMTPFGYEPPRSTTLHIEEPRREHGIVAGNWWRSEHAAIPADEAALAQVELASGQRVRVLELTLDDGSTLWISEAAPLDRIVRHETAAGELKRELLAHGRWLGTWIDESGLTYGFTGSEAILAEEVHGYSVTDELGAGAVTLALQTEAGEAAGTITLTPQAADDDTLLLSREGAEPKTLERDE